ncbi:MAG: potassium channel family protein [Vulcanimicrobiota bacterium]
MFLIIAGGGRIGYYLMKMQIKKENEVVIIEKDRNTCNRITEEAGNLAICGDACDPRILKMAGISRAEMILACTDKDEDNLVICQLATKKFHVPHTVSIVNDPAKKDFFKKLGVEAVVSATDAVLELVQKNITHKDIFEIIDKENEYEVLKINLPLDSPAVGKPLNQLPVPANSKICSILRKGKIIPVNADTKFEENDIVYSLVHFEEFSNLKTTLLGYQITK